MDVTFLLSEQAGPNPSPTCCACSDLCASCSGAEDVGRAAAGEPEERNEQVQNQPPAAPLTSLPTLYSPQHEPPRETAGGGHC